MAYIPRWYFNASWNNCTKFLYGGCQGNGNNFKSKKECEEKCLHVQQGEEGLESSHGPVGPCTKKLKLRYALRISGVPFPLFRYTPACDAEGYYKPMQCRHSGQKCWCVDRWGNRIKDSEERHTRGAADELDCS